MRFLATVLLLAGAAMYAQDAPKKGPGGPPQPHKNLKILTDDEVRPMMGAFRAALGQQCTFCHVQGDFAADTNPKKDIARKMIKMVNDDNAMFADGKVHVTCYTCHRGKNMPETVPPPAAPGQ
uniref:Photosynthetic reaction center cytochrome c subunit n=1 Tax=Solibacter usitatus (strain Ellin6076) TaxID=234267 RepID=Q020W4_SOLUE